MAGNEDNTYKIPDQVWEQIQPLLVPVPVKLSCGSPEMDDREVMEAIFYMLRVQGNLKDMKAGSPLYQYFTAWRKTGVFDRLWQSEILTKDEMRTLVLWGD